jgi:F-type H+-transporting ATPase subunit gamma
MTTAREMRQRIKSVNNISQVTRALEAVSASRVRRAEEAVRKSRPYASKSWQVLRHLSLQPARDWVHPLLERRAQIRNVLTLVITGDRGLAGAYNSNVIRFTLRMMGRVEGAVSYVTVGRKGREILRRRGVDFRAEFSDLPAEPTFADVSAIGRLVLDEYLDGRADQVILIYTDFINMLRQRPTLKQLLPLQIDSEFETEEPDPLLPEEVGDGPQPSYIYEPGEEELINFILPRFTQLQVYQAIQESLASEHAARMVAMRNATDNAEELAEGLQLQYNKARQQAITSEMLDIVGGVEAQD